LVDALPLKIKGFDGDMSLLAQVRRMSRCLLTIYTIKTLISILSGAVPSVAWATPKATTYKINSKNVPARRNPTVEN